MEKHIFHIVVALLTLLTGITFVWVFYGISSENIDIPAIEVKEAKPKDEWRFDGMGIFCGFATDDDQISFSSSGFYVSKDGREVSESMLFSETAARMKSFIDKRKKKAAKIINSEQVKNGNGEKVFLSVTGDGRTSYEFFYYEKNSDSVMVFSSDDLKTLQEFEKWHTSHPN